MDVIMTSTDVSSIKPTLTAATTGVYRQRSNKNKFRSGKRLSGIMALANLLKTYDLDLDGFLTIKEIQKSLTDHFEKMVMDVELVVSLAGEEDGKLRVSNI